MRAIFLSLFILIVSCKNSEKDHKNDEFLNMPILTVLKIENGKDGYTAFLEDEKKGNYTMLVSIPNLEDNYIRLEVGDKVKVIGEYAESDPVQIFPKKIAKVKP